MTGESYVGIGPSSWWKGGQRLRFDLVEDGVWMMCGWLSGSNLVWCDLAGFDIGLGFASSCVELCLPPGDGVRDDLWHCMVDRSPVSIR